MPAVREAAATDAKYKRDTGNLGLLQAAVIAHRVATGWLQCATDPRAEKVCWGPVCLLAGSAWISLAQAASVPNSTLPTQRWLAALCLLASPQVPAKMKTALQPKLVATQRRAAELRAALEQLMPAPVPVPSADYQAEILGQQCAGVHPPPAIVTLDSSSAASVAAARPLQPSPSLLHAASNVNSDGNLATTPAAGWTLGLGVGEAISGEEMSGLRSENVGLRAEVARLQGRLAQVEAEHDRTQRTMQAAVAQLASRLEQIAARQQVDQSVQQALCQELASLRQSQHTELTSVRQDLQETARSSANAGASAAAAAAAVEASSAAMAATKVQPQVIDDGRAMSRIDDMNHKFVLAAKRALEHLG
eukprot:COSAG01_NODE_25_length_37050_cov_211.559119_27_plen_363_part_00